MNPPALIASDVDGTLLDADEIVTARTSDAVAAAIAGGATFVLATGRPPRWIGRWSTRWASPRWRCAPTALCSTTRATDRIISARTLSTDVLAELAEIATRAIPGAGLAVERVGRSAHDAATPQFVSSPGYEHAWLNPDNTEVSLQDLLSAPAVKLLIRKADARSADMAAALAPHVGDRRRHHLLDRQRPDRDRAAGISKASGVEELAHPLGIAAEDVVAFGDMPNDCRCWPGRATASRWATPIRRCWRWPTRSRRPTPRRGGPGAGTVVAVAQLAIVLNRSSLRRRAVRRRRRQFVGESVDDLDHPGFSRSKFSVPCWKFCTIHCGSAISALVGSPRAPCS